ncbi:fibronectin type III domain-containing protein [uncultured Chryseobacterium sp.]|uniref:fibronectin type III domain-containing protein n=1 Tax=uncultured Chryseobacterium sp. TaxID=259322 RepID=UPI0025902607|nr:fibronectin type III domain-containing protein [uncultured Chryseobacterium sp.]
MINKIKNYFQRYRSKRQKLTAHSMRLLTLLLLTAYSLLPVAVKSQQYPVKLVPVVMPPYSLRIGDYATSTDNKLQLQVLMTDLLEPQHQTGIKFSLEAGLNAVPLAKSNDFVVGMNPFTLYPGNNITLTNVDLRSLFELQNLSGINAVQYSKPLSDGVYQFCFQAYDYYTKNNLSAKTCAPVFLVQYDPPMLTLPQNAEKVQTLSPYTGGAGIVFQWMPRQIAPNTRYIFTLKELWDMGQSPVSGFLSAPALWTEETYVPTLYYGIDKTQLIPGKRYAWQVQAKSGNPVLGANPTDDNGVYKNNGLSEIYYFDYVENCAVPTLLTAKNVGRGRVELNWSIAGQPAGLYNVQYRKKGSKAEWVTQQSYQPSAILTGLEDQTEYEYRIGSVCGNVQTFNSTNPSENGNSGGNAYSYSGVHYFTTDSNDVDNNYQCGIMPAIDIANKTPLQDPLRINDVFMAGDFPVTILEISGGNGTYSGKGWIDIPYLSGVKVKVDLNNIQLNTDKKLIGGVVETTYDPEEKNVVGLSSGLNDLGNLFTEIVSAINNALSNGGMTKAEWEKLYDDINTFTDEGGQTASGLYEQGLVTDEQKEKLDKLKEEIDELLKNLTCAVKEGEKQKGSDGIIENECEEKEKELKEKIGQYNNELKETAENACIWNVGEREELKGKTFYFQQKVEDKALHKLKSGDFPLSFNRFGNVYTFSSNGQVYYPEAGTGKFTTKDVVKYYQFENAGEPISISVTENTDDQITIDGQKEIAMKDCSSGNKDKGNGLGKGTLYTKNVEGRYKVTVTENNGKISSKFELTGSGNSKTESQKVRIEQEVQNSINDALKDLKNPKDINSLSAKTQVNDFGFYVKQMSGKEWVETLSELGDNVWENAALPRSYWNEDEGSKTSNVQMPALFSGVADGVIGEVTEYPQLIKLGYDVSTKSEVRQGLWNSIKNMSPESIKNASLEFYEQKKANYTSSKSYIVNHTVGQDGVTVVSLAMGAGFFKNGTDGLKDGIEDTGEKLIKNELDDSLEKIIKKLKGAKGLVGKDYEDFLATHLPNGGPGFSKMGRDFDAFYDNNKIWVEAKSGRYWENIVSTDAGFSKFKSDMGHRLQIATDNGAKYELFSNTEIPENVKAWLLKKGIKYYETIE